MLHNGQWKDGTKIRCVKQYAYQEAISGAQQKLYKVTCLNLWGPETSIRPGTAGRPGMAGPRTPYSPGMHIPGTVVGPGSIQYEVPGATCRGLRRDNSLLYLVR